MHCSPHREIILFLNFILICCHQRLFVLRYAIEVAICALADGEDPENFNTKVMDVSGDLVHHLRIISDLDDNMTEAFDCSFLYFYKGILPTLMKHLYKSSLQSSPRLQLVLSAFSDPCLLLSSKYLESKNDEKSPLHLEQYRSFVINEALHSALLIPICEYIENNLRLHVYAKNIKEIKPPNPRKEQSKHHILWFLELPLLHVCGISIDIKGYIQRHLESSFYNFSTVGLQDSQSYVEMSVLARDMYGLDLIDNCLPAGSVDQGIDLVAIAEDIKCKSLVKMKQSIILVFFARRFIISQHILFFLLILTSIQLHIQL